VIPTATLVLVALVFSLVVFRDDGGNTRKSYAEGSISATTVPARTTTSINPETELVARLKEILARREAAYDQRDPEILKKIYTSDCPCLKSDSNAIRELISEDYVWVGGETTIDVRRLERVSTRMWIVIADFTSEALRIETESGQLVRTEPRGSDLFQFVLAIPIGSTQWLLGRATSFESG
jgi:hypothetical protein